MRGHKRLVDIVQTFEVGNAGVDFNNDVLCALKDLRRGADRRSGDNPAILSNRCRLYDSPVERLLGVAVLLVQGIVPVCEVLGEHREMFVGELDAPRVDTFGDVLADLMWVATGDPGRNWCCGLEYEGEENLHIHACPAVLDFGTDGGADEEVKFLFCSGVCLEVVVLDVICDSLYQQEEHVSQTHS